MHIQIPCCSRCRQLASTYFITFNSSRISDLKLYCSDSGAEIFRKPVHTYIVSRKRSNLFSDDRSKQGTGKIYHKFNFECYDCGVKGHSQLECPTDSTDRGKEEDKKDTSRPKDER